MPDADKTRTRDLRSMAGRQIEGWLALAPPLKFGRGWRETLDNLEELNEFLEELLSFEALSEEALRSVIPGFQSRLLAWLSGLAPCLVRQ